MANTAHCSGQRRSLPRPTTIFVVANVVFLLSPILAAVNTGFRCGHRHSSPILSAINAALVRSPRRVDEALFRGQLQSLSRPSPLFIAIANAEPHHRHDQCGFSFSPLVFNPAKPPFSAAIFNPLQRLRSSSLLRRPTPPLVTVFVLANKY